MTPVNFLVVKCFGRAGNWLGDLEFADSAGGLTIHSDDATGEISISEAGSYALLFRRSSDYAVRFAAPIANQRVGRGDPFGSLRSHTGLGAISVGLDDPSGLPLWRRLIRIRPTKFNDVVEFETMVDDICEVRISLALDHRGRVSAPWAAVEVDRGLVPEEELAVLRNAIDRELLFDALSYVARNSHARLERDDVLMRLGEGAIDPGRFGLHLAGAGRRFRIPIDHPLRAVAGSLPAETPSARRVDSHDTPANRFAKFVVRSFLDRLERAMRSGITLNAPIAQWAVSTIAQLKQALSQPPLSRIGSVSRIEIGDPTIQRRQGYRSILRAYLAARAGLTIGWPEISDIIFAETRDTPQLYEIWCLLKLREAIETLYGVELSKDHFSRIGENVVIRRGSVATSSGPVTINGQPYVLGLWYNRTFSPSANIQDGYFRVHSQASGTWSKPMKPDFSIELRSSAECAEQRIGSAYIHLDAKYRLKTLATADQEASERSYAPDDIDKMHAYLAGIEGSCAAHVLYPGDRTVFFRREHSSTSVGAISAIPGNMIGFSDRLRNLIEETLNTYVSTED